MTKKSDLKLIVIDDYTAGLPDDHMLRIKMPYFNDEEIFNEGFFTYGGVFKSREDLVGFLMENMIEHHGIGLSANQMGIPVRAFVMGRKGYNHSFACFNPRIISSSDALETSVESCLSLPNVQVMKERPESVRAKFTDVTGKMVITTFTGIYSRIYQHELDHVNGVLMTDGVNSEAIKFQKRETSNTYR